MQGKKADDSDESAESHTAFVVIAVERGQERGPRPRLFIYTVQEVVVVIVFLRQVEYVDRVL